MQVSSLRFPAQPTLPDGDITVTRTQGWAIERAVRTAWEYDAGSYDPSSSEFKEFEIKALGAGGVVVVRTTIGRKNDESTMASVFCRYRRQMFIGKRGKIMTYGAKGKKLVGDKALIYGVDR